MTADRAIRQAARRARRLGERELLAECEVSFFVAGGPGGQHRNRRASGVRLRHPETGVTVQATERRSQAQNRSAALARLRARFADLAYVRPPRRPTRPPRAAERRRVEAKRRRGQKKAQRRGDPLA